MTKDFLQAKVMVAGICAATVALGRVGLLDERKHTSNDLGMLKKLAPTYRGEKNYVNKLVVRDGNLITAPGVGYLEFTMELMSYLNLYPEEKRSQWYALFRNGTPPPPSFWGM